MSKKADVRATAALVLNQVLPEHLEEVGHSLNDLMAQAEAKVGERNCGLFRNLCYGTLRWYSQLHCVIQSHLSKPLKKKDHDLFCLLLVGAYQLKFLNIPDHAAISETVDGVIALRKPWAKGLVNGVLRSLQRDGMDWKFSDEAVLYSHPLWLIERIKEDWPEHWQAVLTQNNERAPLTIRSNQRQIQRADLLAQLQRAAEDQPQLACHATRFSPLGIQFEEPMDVPSIPGFEAGLFSVQDESPQLLATLLDPQPDSPLRVLDACAAPGGKTSLIMEALPNATLDAVDVSEKRLAKLRDNCRRLDLKPNIICDDLLEPEEWWDGQAYDYIVLDAPCSATGVIRRHPDIKWVRKADDVQQLAKLQLSMLKTLWPLLKPNGILIYCTCSIIRSENRHQVEQFLAQQDDAQALPINAEWGIDETVGRQLLPQANGNDGFFYARLQKRSP